MSRFVRWLRSGSGLPLAAATSVACMVLVIVQGAVVRATGSGNGCGSHWPLCNGDFIPHHPRIATIIEFMHRSLTGVCSTLVFGTIAWTFLARPRGHRARKAAVWSGVLLIVEALLGAWLVLGGYVEHNASNMRVLVQCVHFTNTMLLLSAVTLMWWWSRDRAPAATSPALRSTAWIALGAALLTGATGSEAAIADTLFPSTSVRAALAEDFAPTAPLLIRMRWVHPATSMLAVLASLWLAWRLRSRAGAAVGALVLLQIALGVADVLLLAPTWMQVLHLLGADLFWIALLATTAEVLFHAPLVRPALVESHYAAV